MKNFLYLENISSGSCRSLSKCRRCGNSWRNFAAKIIGSLFFSLIMNQKTFQPGFDKFVDYCLNLFPVITVDRKSTRLNSSHP